MAVSQSAAQAVAVLLSHRHDQGADWWTTPDRKLLKGAPFTTLESALYLLELGVAPEHEALRGVALLMQSIEKVQSRINPSLEIYGVLVTMFTRTLHSDEVLQRIYEAFGDKVFHSVISRSIKLPDANVAAAPITFFAHNHKTAKEYREVAREMIYRDIVA